ncbi:MAG: hypothetical protein M9938_10750 [Solirubrobacterales bacterium]|nr:hypothetical protein [Solirubrobacterales bacterium]
MKRLEITPTLKTQCWGFMIGSLLFAAGSFEPIAAQIGTKAANVLFFIGSWGFTTAAFVQLHLSGPSRNEHQVLRAIWLAAATQFVGTILFNISTGSAINATTQLAEEQMVWKPDAEGSVFFLISGVFSLLALSQDGKLWGPANRDWLSAWVNMAGCIAFGISAFAAVITPGGGVENATLAGWATFAGAGCFFLASALSLPEAYRPSGDAVPDPEEDGLDNSGRVG